MIRIIDIYLFHHAGQLNFYLFKVVNLYMLLYIALVVFFCFFYTAITLNPMDLADNLKKSGAFIPGIKPGKHTADYIDHILVRITVVGALILVVVALVPDLLKLGHWMADYYYASLGETYFAMIPSGLTKSPRSVLEPMAGVSDADLETVLARFHLRSSLRHQYMSNASGMIHSQPTINR